MPTTTTRPAASQPSNFARAAVYLEFRSRDARAVDQGDFVDRAPDHARCQHIQGDASGEVALDQLTAALRLDADDAESQAA